jgi:hypothetical protein
MIKQLLSISSNTPDPVIYILTALIPIEAQIQIRALTLFGNVCPQDEACIAKQLAIRQLRVKSMNSNSWFIEIPAIMYNYNLGDALYWIENPMKKEQAMKVIKKEVSDYWTKYIQDMTILYQGLRYLDVNNYTPGKLHKLLTRICKSKGDRHRIPIKLKMLTGSYILQSLRHMIFNEGTYSLCMACNNDDETLEHMILHCKAWSKAREQILPAIERLLSEG